MQNPTFLEHLRPILAPKMKTAPPKGFGSRSREGVAVMRPEELLEFVISAEKSVSILVKSFFFEDHLVLGEKPFEFEISAEKSISTSLAVFLTFQKSPPPP